MSKVDPHVQLSSLVGLFYRRSEELGRFEQIQPELLSDPYRRLLAHPHHMTVAMEEYHKGPVDVRVLQVKTDGSVYARRILLQRHADGRVVQFGIMRMNFDFVSDDVRREVESQSTPLGRILIAHNALWKIELNALWRVKPGGELCRQMGIGPKQTTYGRTAFIRGNGAAAVELLEIVTPE